MVGDIGGKALTVDGYYLLMVPSGTCTVAAAAECHDIATAEEIVVDELGMVVVDLCLDSQSGLSGRVTSNGAPVQGVKLFLYADGSVKVALTDGEGRYAFMDLAEGVYSLFAFLKEYRLASIHDISYNGATCLSVDLDLVKR